ncbi:trypsin-like serine protease [Vibrio parahaemolyticus]|uniref:trypsin-like serine protease n=1 Tax=Vibrio parahaemolyticus TaxID=670 RepID=UPI00235EDEB3|nr:trypsin-like serine protease [Vibrio parahaemolyticus]
MKSKKLLSAILAMTAVSSPLALASTTNGTEQVTTGGVEVLESNYPWQVKVITTMNGVEEAKVCGGAIIDTQWAVTSAQCFFDVSKGLDKNDIESVQVSFPDYDGEGLATLNIDKFFVHSSATGNPADANDIALVKFNESSFPMNGVIQLMTADEDENVLTQQKSDFWVENQERLPLFVTTGYQGSLDGALKRDYLSGVPNDKCDGYNTRLTHCGTTPHPEYTQGMCYGDLGAPLIWKNPNNAGDNNKGLRLAGIASIGKDNCDNNNYSEFTNIADYVDWIKNTITAEIGEEYVVNQLAQMTVFSYDPLADENMPSYTDKGEVGGNSGEDPDFVGDDNDNATDGNGDSGDKSGGGFGLGVLIALGATAYSRRKKK